MRDRGSHRHGGRRWRRRMHGPRRLYARIYIHFVGVLIVVGVASTWVFANGWNHAFLRHTVERLATHVAVEVGEHWDDGAARHARLVRIADEFDVNLTLRALDGTVVDAAGPPLPPLSASELEAMRRPRAVGYAPIERHGWRPWMSPWMVIASVPGGPPWQPGQGTRGERTVRGVLSAGLAHRLRGPSPWRPLMTVALVLLVAAMATAPLARRISRPVERLTEATRRFGRGELAARVFDCPHPGRRDELSELTQAWNDMAERIERLVQGHKELLANVSHELRSPLARIRLALELLPRDHDGSTEARLADVEQDLAELDKLIDDVLTTSRLEQAGLPLRRETVRVRALLEPLVERARHHPRLAGQEVRLVVDEAADALAASLDPALVKRAIWNLMENAGKYGAPPITVEARAVDGAGERGRRLVLRVTDEGAGIPPEERERVFAPFVRGDRAHTPAAKGERPAGFGLGLTLARRIAEVHGGTIAASPARVEGAREIGCAMTLSLPLA